VRSVENRLQRVYEKLGISTRAALPHALSLGSASPAGADLLQHQAPDSVTVAHPRW
jgi:hypothetical protein